MEPFGPGHGRVGRGRGVLRRWVCRATRCREGGSAPPRAAWPRAHLSCAKALARAAQRVCMRVHALSAAARLVPLTALPHGGARRYVILVADHMTGFTLWDTKIHNYSIAGTRYAHATAAATTTTTTTTTPA